MRRYGQTGGIGPWMLMILVVCLIHQVRPVRGEDENSVGSGTLRIIDPPSDVPPACPLRHTDVEADIAGFLARTTVRQEFYNPLDVKIEAVYVFPLPQDAAVDTMVMTVGDRRVVGEVHERGEAGALYRAARAAGQVASLLDQERPNIFTQSVVNVEPGVSVVIEISYVETLRYEDGVFTWVFPMVVGPRYVPGGGAAPAPMTKGRRMLQVPDGDRITPPIIPEGMRAGHDVSIRVHIDAGMELRELDSVLHEVDVETEGSTRATVTLRDKAVIPNKDFILRYGCGGSGFGDAFLLHHDERGDFFTLILQPPERVSPSRIVPRELVFVLDTSGSMMGPPIETSKKLMRRMLDSMQPADTFNIITFAGGTRVLWPEPRPNTAANRVVAARFLENLRGSGGTEMMKAIDAALVREPIEASGGGATPIRVVCFLTDGYVGNDMAMIAAVRKNADTTRVFSFGIGNSVNRYLLDGMARAGRGEAEIVPLASSRPEAVTTAADRFAERVRVPVLTDIDIDWGTLPVVEVYPRRIPDLFAAEPIVVYGRLTGPPVGTITLRGNTAAGGYREQIDVSQPATPPDHSALASLWARAKVDDLMNRDLGALQRGQFPQALRQQIVDLGVGFHLVTQFTSFVAVEKMTITVGGEPRTIDVPVEMPEGVSYQGVFGGGGGCLFAGAPAMTLSSAAKYQCRRAAGEKARPGRVAGVVGGVATISGRASASAEDRERRGPAEDAARTPTEKLAEPLRRLAASVAARGDNGNFDDGRVHVAHYRLTVMVFLEDASVETLAALKRLGFESACESRTVRMLVGTIDVRKLDALAGLRVVREIRPIGAHTPATRPTWQP